MEIKAIELTVHSCKDLKGFNFFQKMSVYAQVWVDDPKKGQKTPSDRENDRNPEWNHRMRFALDEPADKLALDFEIRKEGGLVDKSIGRVHVPVLDLLQDYTGGVRYVCYQVKGSNDEATGLLNFSYKFERKDNSSFHCTSPKQDAGKLNPMGSACSGCYHAPPAPTVVSESLFAVTPSVVYPPVGTYCPPQAPHSAHPSDQPPPTFTFGSYQPETSCLEAHQAPSKPLSASYLPIPAEAERHHLPPSLQIWPPHPSELTAPINSELSAAQPQPQLVLPHFPPPFPPPPPALPFPPPQPLHQYYHHPPLPPADYRFRPCPFGFMPHGPPYWR